MCSKRREKDRTHGRGGGGGRRRRRLGNRDYTVRLIEHPAFGYSTPRRVFFRHPHPIS